MILLNYVCGTENRLLIKLLYCIKLIAHVDQIMGFIHGGFMVCSTSSS